MAVRIQNLPKKNIDQPHFTISCPSWKDSNEQPIPQALSEHINFKVESPPQPYHEARHLGLPLSDQESSSTQSIGQSRNEVVAFGGTYSQAQCLSSETADNESYGKSAEDKLKPGFLFSAPDITFNPSQAASNCSMARAPFPCAQPFYGGFLTPYGTQAVIPSQLGSQMVGMTPARVPLPLDLADDGPIYVNAKQYHGILRRRQSRARLEAQNKLLKSRKPYLHESRHLHALNRVRGSGGRFLSAKKVQQHVPTSFASKQSVSDTTNTLQLGSSDLGTGLSSLPNTTSSRTVLSGASNATCSDVTSVSNSDLVFMHPDSLYSGLPAHVSGGTQSSGGLMCTRTQQYASSVR